MIKALDVNVSFPELLKFDWRVAMMYTVMSCTGTVISLPTCIAGAP